MAGLLRDEIEAYYASGAEADRLDLGYFQLERSRTKNLLSRKLPAAPGLMLDVGGGTGPYARFLTAAGYTVYLLDPIASHVEMARRPAEGGPAPAEAIVGDARDLPWEEAVADAVLLLGPLYHLPEHEDRERVLAEAFRVLRPGGVVFVAGISRMSPLLDGIVGSPTGRPGMAIPLPIGLRIVREVFRTGHYSNPFGDPSMFTTAYMHTPHELVAEVEQAGFTGCELYAVEGPGAYFPGFESLYRRERGRRLLEGIATAVSRLPWLRGATPHLLAFARKPYSTHLSGQGCLLSGQFQASG